MNKINLEKVKKAEAKFFDKLADFRTKKEHIIAFEIFYFLCVSMLYCGNIKNLNYKFLT